MAETTQLERFLKNEPLTEELEALRDRTDEPAAIPEKQAVDTRAITDDDREHLRRLKFEPGWPIILRILDREIARQEETAKQMSMDDPLGNGNAVAQAWAYVAMQKRVRAWMFNTLELEVQQLADKSRGQK